MWNATTISSYVSALNNNLGSMDVSYVHGILSEEERWDGCVSSLLKYMNIFRGYGVLTWNDKLHQKWYSANWVKWVYYASCEIR